MIPVVDNALPVLVWSLTKYVHDIELNPGVFLQVVFKLNYIPHETLRTVLSVLKQIWAGTLAGGQAGRQFGVVALKCFHR